MLLATTTVADIEQFLKVFGTAGADKRALHGSKSAVVYRDPNENNRMWVVFDWDEQGWADFVSDPEVPAVLKDAGINVLVFDSHMSVMEGSLGVLPRRLMVADDDLAHAKKVLTEAEPPEPDWE